MNINKLPKIYALIDPISKEIRYVGQTMFCPKKRLKEHLHGSSGLYYDNHNKRWIRKLLKNNLKPKIIILEYNAIWEKSEIRWIKKFRDAGYNLTNSTNGGEGIQNYKHSIKTKNKMSKSHKGKLGPNTGKTFSIEVKRKMGIAHYKKVECIETGIIYNSLKEAAKVCNLKSPNNISMACNGKRKTAGKMHWRKV